MTFCPSPRTNPIDAAILDPYTPPEEIRQVFPMRGSQRRSRRKSLLVLLAAVPAAGLIVPSSASACEPLVPLIWVFLAPTAVGGFLFASAVGFALVVAVKCGIFVWKSDFKSWSAVLYVLVANIVSTAVGGVVAVVAGNPILVFLVVGFLILFLAYLPVGRRVRELNRSLKIPTPSIALVLTGITIATSFLFGCAAGEMLADRLGFYWILKVSASIAGIGLSLIISVVYEETVISGLYGRFQKRPKSFMNAVLWANIVAILLLTFIGAGLALPKRFASPDFLYSSAQTPQNSPR